MTNQYEAKYGFIFGIGNCNAIRNDKVELVEIVHDCRYSKKYIRINNTIFAQFDDTVDNDKLISILNEIIEHVEYSDKFDLHLDNLRDKYYNVTE